MHVLLFDIDGTLINSGGAGQAALQEAMAVQFQVMRPAKVPIHGQTDRSIASHLFQRHGIEDSENNWQCFCGAYLSRLPLTLSENHGQVLPGVVQLLTRLNDRGDVALGLLTGNVPEGARLKLEYFGLYHHFRFGGFGDRHRRREDVAHDAFAAARQHFDGRVTAERTYVIGDTPNDIRCARAIGARVVAVATGFYSSEQLAADGPDLLFEDLVDPGPLLRWLS